MIIIVIIKKAKKYKKRYYAHTYTSVWCTRHKHFTYVAHRLGLLSDTLLRWGKAKKSHIYMHTWPANLLYATLGCTRPPSSFSSLINKTCNLVVNLHNLFDITAHNIIYTAPELFQDGSCICVLRFLFMYK